MWIYMLMKNQSKKSACTFFYLQDKPILFSKRNYKHGKDRATARVETLDWRRFDKKYFTVLSAAIQTATS